jgi:hypothetical protein
MSSWEYPWFEKLVLTNTVCERGNLRAGEKKPALGGLCVIGCREL